MQLKHFLMEGEGDGTGANDSSGGNAGEHGNNDPANSDQGTPAQDKPWYNGASEDVVAFIQNKGWQDDPLRVVEGYRNAEKLVGADPKSIVKLPREGDADGWNEVWTRLGAPESADGYEFDAPEGVTVDAEYMNWAKEMFAGLKVPASMAKQIVAKNNELVAQREAAAEEQYNNQVAADKEALKKEWAQGHDNMMNVAKQAANSLGFTPEMVDSIEKTVGYAGTYKFLASLGEKMGEAKFVSGDGNQGGDPTNITPAQAQAKVAEFNLQWGDILRDPTHPLHKGKVAERRQLIGLAYPT